MEAMTMQRAQEIADEGKPLHADVEVDDDCQPSADDYGDWKRERSRWANKAPFIKSQARAKAKAARKARRINRKK